MVFDGIPIVDAHCHLGYFGGWANVGITAEELIALNKEFNVVHSVVFAQINSLSAEAERSILKNFTGYVWLNPFEGDKAVNELRIAVKEWGCKGVKLHPLFQAFIADDPIVYPIMDEARKLKIPVAIHSGHPPFSLPWSIGELAEVYPDVTIVMLHMGHWPRPLHSRRYQHCQEIPQHRPRDLRDANAHKDQRGNGHCWR